MLGALVRKCKLSFLSLRDWGCFWRSLRCFVPSSRSSIDVKTAAKRRACAGSSPDNPHVIGFFGRRGNRPFLASGNRFADGLNLTGVIGSPRAEQGNPNLYATRVCSEVDCHRPRSKVRMARDTIRIIETPRYVMQWAIRRQEPPGEESEVGRRCPMRPRPALGSLQAPCQAAESALIVT